MKISILAVQLVSVAFLFSQSMASGFGGLAGFVFGFLYFYDEITS